MKLLEEKLRVNAAIKAKKRAQGELAQAFIDLGKDAPEEESPLRAFLNARKQAAE